MRHLSCVLVLVVAAPLAAQQCDSYIVSRPTAVRTAPDAKPLGQLQPGATIEVLARDRGWVRVRADGWIRESDILPADTTLRSSISAADLRADPVGSRGKLVRWQVQALALQTADPLRHGLAEQELYLLARGPGAENSLLYLVVPPSLLGTARALQPLAPVAITARVRDGRSEPVGIPILDLLSLTRIP